MAQIQIGSVTDPFGGRTARLAIDAICLAEAMGLFPEDDAVDRLDIATLRRVMTLAAGMGIGRGLLPSLAGHETDPAALGEVVEAFVAALQGSPVPELEWPSMILGLGPDLLARLLAVSPSSVNRYASGRRATPDDVAARLHFLTRVVADLRGAYNDIGARRWFDRARSALEGRSPADLLGPGWKPEDRGPAQVLELARSLVFANAT